MQTHSSSSSVASGAWEPDRLDALVARIPGLDALAIVTREGEVKAAAGVEADAIRALGGFLIGLQDLGERVAVEAGRGSARFSLLACDLGHLAVHVTHDDLLLLALCNIDAPLGVAVHDVAVWSAPTEGVA